MQFYNGDVKMEPGAVVCRVSPSFIRFGTFQLPVSRGIDQHHLCENLIEYLQKYHFPELVGKPDANLKMLETIVERTAELVAKWQLIGFVHGAKQTTLHNVLLFYSGKSKLKVPFSILLRLPCFLLCVSVRMAVCWGVPDIRQAFLDHTTVIALQEC